MLAPGVSPHAFSHKDGCEPMRPAPCRDLGMNGPTVSQFGALVERCLASEFLTRLPAISSKSATAFDGRMRGRLALWLKVWFPSAIADC
jgi:hypothetical protein